MEDYIPISKINDFLFCPKSLYLHLIYENFSEKMFHDKPQTEGKLNHKTIEKNSYSTSKKYIVGKEVYSDKYKIMGKIDIYNADIKTLIERKTKIKNIYKGYIYQLYAQFFCLREMGYEVNKIILRSLKDNKNYEIPLPSDKDIKEFKSLLEKIRHFRPFDLINHHCQNCSNNIYSILNW